MTFPNTKVQPHWLAALERAKEALPNCRWVCVAVDRGVEPEIEQEVCEAIAEAIQPWAIVNTWYFHETGTELLNSKDYRIAWIDHMIEQCRRMQETECLTSPS
jgi:hypothetical protein